MESHYKWLQVDNLDEGIIGIQLRSRANLKDFIKCGWLGFSLLQIYCFFSRLLLVLFVYGNESFYFYMRFYFSGSVATPLANMKSRSTGGLGEEKYSSSKSIHTFGK